MEEFDIMQYVVQGSDSAKEKQFSGTSANVCLYRSTPTQRDKPVVYGAFLFIYLFWEVVRPSFVCSQTNYFLNCTCSF